MGLLSPLDNTQYTILSFWCQYLFYVRRFSSNLVESGGFEPQLLRPFANAYAITSRFTASTTLMWHHSPKSGVFNKQPTPIAVYSPFSARSQGKVFTTKPFHITTVSRLCCTPLVGAPPPFFCQEVFITFQSPWFF